MTNIGRYQITAQYLDALGRSYETYSTHRDTLEDAKREATTLRQKLRGKRDLVVTIWDNVEGLPVPRYTKHLS